MRLQRGRANASRRTKSLLRDNVLTTALRAVAISIYPVRWAISIPIARRHLTDLPQFPSSLLGW